MSMLELCNTESVCSVITHPAGWQRRPNPPLHLPVCACCCNQQSHCDPAAMWQHCSCILFPLFLILLLNKHGAGGLLWLCPTGSTDVGLLSRHLILCNCSDGLHGLWVFQYIGIIILQALPVYYIFTTVYVYNCPPKYLTWGQIHECVTSRWGTRGNHQWCYRGWGDDWVLRLRDVRHHRHHKNSHQHHWLSRSHKTYGRRRRGRK